MARRISSKQSLITLAALLVASAAGNIYLYEQYTKAQDSNPSVQASRIVAELRKTTTLPDEQPSILTVVDKNKLSNRELAQNAQNGDKILLFQQAAKAVIYRPSSNKLVAIMALTPTSSTQQ